MTKRRQYKSGTIFQRKNGLWIGKFEAGTKPDGSRRRIAVSAKTEALCKERLEAKKLEIARHGLPDLGSREWTVKTWSEQWLKIVTHELRPKSYATAQSSINKWITPTIGHKRLHTLTPADIRAVTQAQRHAGRKAASLVRTYIVLMQMLKTAQTEGAAIPSRVFNVKRPRDDGDNDRLAIPLQDAIAILNKCDTASDRALWAAMFVEGLRQGERLGLTWDHVDFDNNTVDISWQLQSLPYNVPWDRDSGYRIPDGYVARQLVDAFHLVRPKSKSSRRIIPLVDSFKVALLAHREATEPNPYGLVWANAKGRPIRAERAVQAWKQLQLSAGVQHPYADRPYDGHEARHSTVTILRELDIPKDTIELIVGHSKFIAAYDHSDRLEDARAALKQLDERLALPASN